MHAARQQAPSVATAGRPRLERRRRRCAAASHSLGRRESGTNRCPCRHTFAAILALEPSQLIPFYLVQRVVFYVFLPTLKRVFTSVSVRSCKVCYVGAKTKMLEPLLWPFRCYVTIERALLRCLAVNVVLTDRDQLLSIPNSHDIEHRVQDGKG